MWGCQRRRTRLRKVAEQYAITPADEMGEPVGQPPRVMTEDETEKEVMRLGLGERVARVSVPRGLGVSRTGMGWPY